MNINNYSYDDNYGKNVKKIKFKPIQIVLISILMIIFVGLAFLYRGLKKNVEERKTASTDTASDEKNLASEITLLKDLYGFSFNLYISGDDANIDFLGDFIPTLYTTHDYILTGSVWKSGADIDIFEGTRDETYPSCTTTIYINESGVYCDTSQWGYYIYPDDYDKSVALPSTYVKIADGKRGEEIIQELCGYFEMSKSYKDVTFGYSDDAKYTVSIPADVTADMSTKTSFPFLSDIKGEFNCKYNVYYDNDGLKNFTLDGESEGLKFYFEAFEEQQYKKPPVLSYYIPLEDYLSYLN